MDVNTLKHDNARAYKALKKEADGSVTVLEPLLGYIPKRFIEISLAEIQSGINTIACVGFVAKDNTYFACCLPATLEIFPAAIREESIDGVRYVVFDLDPGDMAFKSLTVVKDPHLMFKLFDELTYYGKLPWYVNTQMENAMLDRVSYITGRGAVSSPQVVRILTSLGQRDPSDLNIPYRLSEAARNDKKPVVVGLNNVSMLVDGTFNKLIGGYDKDTLISAILNKDDRVTTNEIIMKGGSLDG